MDKNSNQINLFKQLQQAYQEENLTLFVGAGVSRTVPNSNAKLWSDLVKEMQDILSTQENDPLCLAQMLFEQNPEKYDEITRNSIDHTNRISDVHKLIAKLKPRTIITTNWDCLLEKALDFEWYDIISCDEDLLDSQRDHKLIKMHGDFSQDDNRFVFKEDDYLNYTKNYPLIETFVKNTLITQNVLFIGYSYSDINLKMIMNWLKNNRSHQDRPLHVIAQYKSDNIRKKYFENWGIEIYICNDEKYPDDAHNLSDDHYSYRLYNFLNELYQKSQLQAHDPESLWTLYEDYSKLPAIPFKTLTVFIPGTDVKCSNDGRIFLDFTRLSSPDFRNNLQEQLKLYIDTKNRNNKEEICKLPAYLDNLINFWSKSGISYLSFEQNDPSANPCIVKLDNTDSSIFSHYPKNINDISYFPSVIFEDHYDETEHFKLVSSFFKQKRIPESLIENINLYIHHSLYYLNKEDSNDIDVRNLRSIIDLLPRYYQNKYSFLVDILTFQDIKEQSHCLYKKIVNNINCLIKKEREKGKYVLLSYSSPSDAIIHLRNYLLFSSSNKIFIAYIAEVKEYVYLSLKYLFSLHFVQNLTRIPDDEKYLNTLKSPPPIHLHRQEIIAFILFINDEKKILELLNGETYLLAGALKLELSAKNVDWLIDDIIPTLVYHSQEPIAFPDGTIWRQRIGFVFILLALNNNISNHLLNKILKVIESNKIIISEPFNILKYVSYFLRTHKDSFNLSSNTFTNFIHNTLFDSVKYLGDGLTANSPYSLESMRIIGEIISVFPSVEPNNFNEFSDSFLKIYLKMHLQGKNYCNQVFAYIFNKSNKERQKIIADKISSIIQGNNSVSVDFEIFKINMINLGLYEFSEELLEEILKNLELKNKSMIFDRNIGWLCSLLFSLEEKYPDSKQKLEETIHYLTPNINL